MSTPEQPQVPERYAGPEGASDRLRLSHELRYAFAASLAHEKDVLDIGAGEGFGALAALKVGAKSIAALDRDAPACARMGERLSGADVRVGDAASLPWAEKTFDLALLLEVLEHLPDPSKAVAEAARVLRDDGLLLVSVPAREEGDNPHHLHEISREQLIGWLKTHFPEVKLFRQASLWGGAILPEVSNGAGRHLEIPPPEPENWFAVAAKGKLPDELKSTATFFPLAVHEARTVGRLAADIRHLEAERDGLKAELAAMRNSARWRVTGWLLRLLGIRS